MKSAPGLTKPTDTTRTAKKTQKSFLARHSLSIVSAVILVTWIVLYRISNEHTHLGAFYGNAIADWSGLLVTVLATKFMYEVGSAESRNPPHRLLRPIWNVLQQHSLTIFLLITGGGWLIAFVRSNPTSKWGQVVGNIVSEWTQILGLLIMTKKLIETHSKESQK